MKGEETAIDHDVIPTESELLNASYFVLWPILEFSVEMGGVKVKN